MTSMIKIKRIKINAASRQIAVMWSLDWPNDEPLDEIGGDSP